MNDVIAKFGPLVGRCMVALIFLLSGIGKIAGFAGTVGYIASKGLPMPEVLAGATIVIEVGASLAIILGWKARLGAAALFLWMIPVTLSFHNFWALPAEQQISRHAWLLKNSVLGLVSQSWWKINLAREEYLVFRHYSKILQMATRYWSATRALTP